MIFRTMKVADAVLAIIEVLSPDTNIHLYLEPYQNGREHGWALSSSGRFRRKVAFAEYRNSDEIIVYVGVPVDFSMQGNVPSKEVWQARQSFRYDDFYGAAYFVVGHLLEEGAPEPETELFPGCHRVQVPLGDICSECDERGRPRGM